MVYTFTTIQITCECLPVTQIICGRPYPVKFRAGRMKDFRRCTYPITGSEGCQLSIATVWHANAVMFACDKFSVLGYHSEKIRLTFWERAGGWSALE